MFILTKDLIKSLCEKLGHAEGAPPVIKKLVRDNFLEYSDDLRFVPQESFEAWGLPLKLIHEIYDWVTENEADQVIADGSSYINYTIRPTLMRAQDVPYTMITGLRMDAEKRRQPEEWAAKKIQRNYRAKKMWNGGGDGIMPTEVADWLDSDDEPSGRPSEAKAQERRVKRAEAMLRRALRRYVQRRRAKQEAGEVNSSSREPSRAARLSALLGAPAEQVPQVAGASSTLSASVLGRRAGGSPKECEVKIFLRGAAASMQRGQNDEQCMRCAQILISYHWLEAVSDLQIVEDRHWLAWSVPWKLAVLVRKELETRNQSVLMNHIGEAAEVARSSLSDAWNWTTSIFRYEDGESELWEGDGESEIWSSVFSDTRTAEERLRELEKETRRKEKQAAKQAGTERSAGRKQRNK